MREVTVHVFGADSSSVEHRTVSLPDGQSLAAFLSPFLSGGGGGAVRVIRNGSIITTLDGVHSGDHLHVMPGPMSTATPAMEQPTRSILGDWGFSPEEVAAAHATLRRQYGASGLTAEQLEAQWLNTDATREEAIREDTNMQGTELHSFLGVVFGFFMGAMAVLILGSPCLKQKLRQVQLLNLLKKKVKVFIILHTKLMIYTRK